MPRKSFPKQVQAEVVVKSLRRCALCYKLASDLTEKSGQLAHIDRDHSNSTFENAAYLCQRHHDQYDTTPSQTKGLIPDELKAHVQALYELVASPDWLYLSSHSIPHMKTPRSRKRSVSLEIYEKRIPIYHTTVTFLRDVTKDLKPDFQLMLKFARDTEEALFLFDDTVAQYLDEMFKKALHLNSVNVQLEAINRGINVGENFSALSQEHMKHVTWFTGQYDVIRTKFAPFLRLT